MLNQVSQEVLESASYRSSGMLRSMSATNMSMPFLDKVQVEKKKDQSKNRKTFQLNFNKFQEANDNS